MKWYCRQVNKTTLTQADFKGQAYEVVKAFYPDVIHLQFQIEDYLEYLRYGSKGSNPALSISKMKAVSYPDFGLELLVSEQMWIDDVCTYDISAKYEKDFKNLYPSDFEDLNLLLLQGHLDHLPGYEFKHDYTIIKSPRAVVFLVDNNDRKIMRFNEIYKFSDGTLTRILEALDYRVKEFKVKQLNPATTVPFDCCEVCGGPHYSFDCQTRNHLVYEPNPSNNYDFTCFDQPPQYHIDQSPPQDLVFDSHMHSYKENNRILEEILRTLEANSPIDVKEPEGSDDYTKVNCDKEQCLSDHYTAPVTPPTTTPSIPFLATMEPADTLLIGDEVISTIPARKTDEFIKFSVDDLDPIPRESEVTSDSNLECDMPINTPLPSTDVREEDFDINLPLGEYVVDFLMKNKDVVGLPRHLVKQLFSHLLKNPSLTKGMSDEPLGDDVTFSNPLFDFNNDFTLCNDNPLFDEEFKDISSLDPFKSTPIIDESSLLVTPLPDPKQICLREVERFDPFFSLT
ncbi:hypothetical protein Tco_1332158 [Tanacetum coccineum]